MVPEGNPSTPYLRVTSAPSIVPTVRFTFRTGRSIFTLSPFSSAGAAKDISSLSKALSRP